MFGFEFLEPEGGFILIILCGKQGYVHFGLSEIGFVLHKIVCRRARLGEALRRSQAETHRQGEGAGRFLGVSTVGEDLGFGSPVQGRPGLRSVQGRPGLRHWELLLIYSVQGRPDFQFRPRKAGFPIQSKKGWIFDIDNEL